MIRTLAMVLALTATGALSGHDAPLRFDAAAAAERAEQVGGEVALELETLGEHPWAGVYYWGDGLGANVSLALAPNAGFVFEWHGCLGLYGRNYGAVTDTGAHVMLEPELPNAPQTSAGIDEDLLPVSWGERRYLVAAAHMADFCNAGNAGHEPRDGVHGLFLLRQGDEKKVAPGRPRTREGEIDCLRERPIGARIVSVGPTRVEEQVGGRLVRGIPVVLDAGREQGAWTGMSLSVVAPGGVYNRAFVTRVSERSSEALMEGFPDPEFRPRVGWRLSTRRD